MWLLGALNWNELKLVRKRVIGLENKMEILYPSSKDQQFSTKSSSNHLPLISLIKIAQIKDSSKQLTWLQSIYYSTKIGLVMWTGTSNQIAMISIKEKKKTLYYSGI